MHNQETIRSARRLLEELKAILEHEGETNWIRGITSALNAISEPDLELAYTTARSIYKTMLGGKGGFSDYYIRRQGHAEQTEANRRFDEVRNELWDLFQNA